MLARYSASYSERVLYCEALCDDDFAELRSLCNVGGGNAANVCGGVVAQ